MRIRIIVLAFSLLVGVVTLPVAAQTCRAPDPIGAGTLSYLQGVASGTDSVSARTRLELHIPSVSPSQVTVVTDSRVCKKVGAAYYGALGKPTTGRSLYVIKVGTTFVAKDPTELAGEWMIAMTIDRHYNVLARFTG